jgi:hypothetical protein
MSRKSISPKAEIRRRRIIQTASKGRYVGKSPAPESAIQQASKD